MNIALYLIALGFGYKVFADASTNTKKSMRRLGRIVGGAMIIMSLGGIVCSTWYISKYNCPVGSKTFWGKSGKICPLTGQILQGPAASAN